MAKNHTLQVLMIGFGKAGHTLHGPHWLKAGYDIVAFDPNPEKCMVTNLPAHMQVAHKSGRLELLSDLDQLSLNRVVIIDIVATSGFHTVATEQILRIIESKGKSGADYTWLMEKPLVSSAKEERQLKQLFQSGQLVDKNTFVNENFNASTGIARAKELIGTRPVSRVDVVFYKDRVPDVLKGRFTDATLGAYGIEMPHLVAIGYTLAGIKPHAVTTLEHNEYLSNVNGIAESTGNYTVIRGFNDTNEVTIRMAQGLGPYKIDADGVVVSCTLGKTIVRYSRVVLEDGTTILIEFDPVADLDRYYSRVSVRDNHGEIISSEVIADNMLAAVINGVARYQRTGKTPDFAEAIRVDTALAHVHAISDYSEDARRQGTLR